MGAPMPTHFDIAVLITVMSCFGLAVLLVVARMAWDTHKGIQEMQRMTKAVAGLVVQETEKIRELMR
jgi:hypothetical protein